MLASNPHAKIDEENYSRDRRLAAAIRRDPHVIDEARKNLQNWAARWGSLNTAWLEWSQILRLLTPEQLADFLESHTPMANRLRQSSPFLGVLDVATASERTD